MASSPELSVRGAAATAPAAGKAFTNLDLIKADTPHTPAKISKMLHQLEFKLQIEMQYKQGIDKMAKLYQADGDKKSRADAESKRVESDRKIQLLQSALKRYKTLHILDDVVEDEDPGKRDEAPSLISLSERCISDRPASGWPWRRRRAERQPPLKASIR